MTTTPRMPPVSYIMPVLNEGATLRRAVTQIHLQDYAGEWELILALAPSRDDSEAIARDLAAEDARIRIIANPDRDIPVGLNLALAAARYEIVVRVDAHAELAPGYTTAAVTALQQTGAVNVGGVMQAEGSHPVQQAIARAYNSPIGLGGGAYHGTGTAGPAESAYLGVFLAEPVRAAGGFDPSLRRGEDWELNLRLRKAGHLVWFDPALRVRYQPRSTWTALAQQFYATGVWRAVITKRVPADTPWRFFVPGVFVVGMTAATLTFGLAAARVLPQGARIAGLVPAGYLGATAAAGFRLPGQRSLRDRLRSTRALVTMHVCWGTGFLVGLLRGGRNTVDRSRAR